MIGISAKKDMLPFGTWSWAAHQLGEPEKSAPRLAGTTHGVAFAVILLASIGIPW